MGSTSKQTKLVKRLASISFNLTGVALSSFTEQEVVPPSKKPSSDAARPTATTDSCSRGHENSDASDCESDCQFESSADWVLEDDTLKRSDVLTLEEVVQRRVKRMRQLMKLYRSQYWGLVEEMRTKYRRFYLRRGKSGWRDDAEAGQNLQQREGGEAVDGGGDGMREPERGNSENIHCGAQGCTSKPLPLSVFCFAHILLEPRQRLYKPCSYVTRMGQNGATSCGKPVLRAVVPPLCGQHFQQAQRQANRSLNKVLPGGVKYNPKLHLIISQYVRVIQSKRRNFEALAAAQLETDMREVSQEETRPSAGGRDQPRMRRRVLMDRRKKTICCQHRVLMSMHTIPL